MISSAILRAYSSAVKIDAGDIMDDLNVKSDDITEKPTPSLVFEPSV